MKIPNQISLDVQILVCYQLHQVVFEIKRSSTTITKLYILEQDEFKTGTFSIKSKSNISNNLNNLNNVNNVNKCSPLILRFVQVTLSTS